MRIGVFTESFLPQVNGVVTSICNSAKVLSKKNTVEIFTVGKGARRVSGCNVHRFRGMKLPTYPEYRFFLPSKSVWRRLSDYRMDIAHVRSSVGFGLVALRFVKKRNIPIVGTFDTPISDYVHYVPILGKIKITNRLLSNTALKYTIWFYNKCDAVIAPSNITAQWLRKMGCKKEITVISNGVDIQRFNPKEADETIREKYAPNKEMILFHVGRITKEKSVGIIVKAAMKLMGEKVVFVIAGRGPYLSEIKRKVKSLGLGDIVKFVGFVSDDDLPKYYASADAFITASTVETEGIVLLEAMASGLPVIGAGAGAIPDIVQDGYNGFVFAPGKHEAMAKYVMELKDKTVRKRLSANSLEVSKKVFNRKNI